MIGDLRKYIVGMPELWVAAAIDEIEKHGGAVLDDPEVDEHLQFIVLKIELPVDALPKFEQWLTEATAGQGSVEAASA